MIRGQDEAEDELDNEVSPGDSQPLLHHIHSGAGESEENQPETGTLTEMTRRILRSGNVTGTLWSLKVVFVRLVSGRPSSLQCSLARVTAS